MSHRRFRLSRRFMLIGGGAAIGLPFLEAMLPRKGDSVAGIAGAQSNPLPARMVIFTYTNGALMQRFTPARSGTLGSADLPEILSAFQQDDRVREISVLTGLSNLAEVVKPDNHWYAYPRFETGEDREVNHHPLGASLFLTGGVSPVLREVAVRTNATTHEVASAGGPSIDRAVGKALRDKLALGSEPSVNISVHNQNSISDGQNLSWGGLYEPTPISRDPLEMFNELFANTYFPGEDNEGLEALAQRRGSVLDGVLVSIDSLKNKLGHEDQLRLDQHLNAVRELESHVQTLPENCSKPEEPADINYARSDLDDRVELMMRIGVMALQCDLRRVMLFSLGQTGGVTAKGDHLHWNPDSQEQWTLYTEQTRWKVNKFARFLEMMEEVSEGEGTLVDQSAIVCSTEYSDGGLHCMDMHPVLLAGRLGGMSHGRHLTVPCSPHRRSFGPGQVNTVLQQYATGGYTPMADFWLSMQRAMGLTDVTRFGASNSWNQVNPVLQGLWGNT